MEHTQLITHQSRFIKNVSLRQDQPFMLMGNDIDGFVDLKHYSFRNWQQVINELPGLVTNLECRGEWDLTLYQVPSLDVPIRKKYGFRYHCPAYRKTILQFSYMWFPEELANIYVDYHVIHFNEDHDYHKTFKLSYTCFLNWIVPDTP